MASFTTVIKEFDDKSNHRTYSLPNNTVQQPKLLVQKRKTAATPEALAEDRLMVVYGTSDPDGLPLAKKIVFEADVRRPANALAADITAAKALFREFVASDEFDDIVDSSDYVQ